MLRPQAVDDAGFTIEQDARRRRSWCAASRPERWVRQTNFDNDEAVGYLADRLARLGVEDALAKAGAEPGDLVRIGDREFDWQPTLYAGVDFVPGNRGTDVRLEEKSNRASAADRLAARKARRVRSADEVGADSSDDLDDIDDEDDAE